VENCHSVIREIFIAAVNTSYALVTIICVLFRWPLHSAVCGLAYALLYCLAVHRLIVVEKQIFKYL